MYAYWAFCYGLAVFVPPKLMLKIIPRDVECPGHTGHKGSSLLDKLNHYKTILEEIYSLIFLLLCLPPCVIQQEGEDLDLIANPI